MRRTLVYRILESAAGVGFGALLVAALVPTAVPMLAELEGKYFPVVTDLQIEAVRPTKNGISVDVKFHKGRDCDFDGLIWYRDTAGGVYQRVRIRFPDDERNDSDRSRATGWQVAKDWQLGMLEEDLEDSVAFTRHICHPLWRTKTQFFPAIPKLLDTHPLP